jgi:hypothetical protein
MLAFRWMYEIDIAAQTAKFSQDGLPPGPSPGGAPTCPRAPFNLADIPQGFRDPAVPSLISAFPTTRRSKPAFSGYEGALRPYALLAAPRG